MTKFFWRCDSCGHTSVSFNRERSEICNECKLPAVRRYFPSQESGRGQ